MNPKVTSGGRSFRGAFLYYLHDPKADTKERVAWTHSVNMFTDDPDRAWRVMAYTALHQDRLKAASGQRMSGRKTEKPVLAYSLSWHPDQKPDPAHMRETALQSLKVLGLEEHEAFIVAHSDTPHRHVHIIANRIHPTSGLVASSSFTFRKLSDFALQYSQTHNLNYSPQRAENKRLREEGKAARYHDAGIAGAWAASRDGAGFVAALAERGFTLAQGNKRLVVVDRYGKAHNPTRHIEGVRAKQLRERLAGIDLTALPDAAAVAAGRAASHAATKKPHLNETDAAHLAPDFALAAKPDIRSDQKAPNQKIPPEQKSPERQRDEERAAAAINRLEAKHRHEQADLTDRFTYRLEREQADLRAAFRLEEQQAQLDQLRARCVKPSFWRRVFGLARRDRRNLERLEQEFAVTTARIDRRVRALREEHARTLEQLRAVQQREKDATLRATFQKSDRQRGPIRHVPSQERSRTKRQERSFEG